MSIIKKRKYWFTLSGIGIVASIVSLFYFGLPLGIDFTGGTLMEIQFKETVRASVTGTGEELVLSGTGGVAVSADREIKNEELKKVFQEVDPELGKPSIVKSGVNGFIIRNKDFNEETHQAIKEKIREKFGPFEEPRFTTIGPTIGQTILQKALYAILITVVVIVIFIVIAFRKIPRRINPLKFGIAAIVALIHDIMITVGVFAIISYYLGYEANSLFITALLTILGYSVNDTIVVFDRIRENLKTQGREETFGDTADKSLKQTIARSINTSLSTLVTLTALFLLGGETIRFFVLTLIIGTIVGTYSSIFLASPLLVAWQPKRRR